MKNINRYSKFLSLFFGFVLIFVISSCDDSPEPVVIETPNDIYAELRWDDCDSYISTDIATIEFQMISGVCVLGIKFDGLLCDGDDRWGIEVDDGTTVCYVDLNEFNSPDGHIYECGETYIVALGELDSNKYAGDNAPDSCPDLGGVGHIVTVVIYDEDLPGNYCFVSADFDGIDQNY